MIKSDPSESDPSPSTGWRALDVARHRGGVAQAAQDDIAEEWPVALVYNGISHAVMMTTPRDLEAFAVGFSLSEGIIRDAADIRDIETTFYEESAEVHIDILQSAFVGLKEKRRAMAGRTGCGVCGIESLDLLDLDPEPIDTCRSRHHGNAANAAATSESPPLATDVSDVAIQRAAGALRAHQHLMRRTGGVHAAAWCSPDGDLLAVFEDVGRHNAMDKLIGRLALDRVDFGSGFVFLSSRGSYELVRKAARMHIPMLATISAPTTLAVRIARQAGVRLASFCRDDGFVDYTAVPGANLPAG
ncbi:formate dehydrogenase accessory sulfurtransferase FdhD [Robbsia sp. KACC 23696]|uniref:formate dehydrogenase accessory sulfurtransferase FdhD n=1 Tax=Robbsia sp. KACC 23696 TaxID=3149231 RepID=UPI00325B8C12